MMRDLRLGQTVEVYEAESYSNARTPWLQEFRPAWHAATIEAINTAHGGMTVRRTDGERRYMHLYFDDRDITWRLAL